MSIKAGPRARLAVFAVIAAGTVGFAVIRVWTASVPLGTFEDECFMPTDQIDQYPYGILKYLMTCGNPNEPPNGSGAEWFGHWLSVHMSETEKAQQRLQQEIQHLDHARSECESAAARCTPKHLLYNLRECLARRFDSAPWREQARVLDALSREKQVEEEAQGVAYCIYSEQLHLWNDLWPRGVPDVLTSWECCEHARRRGPDVLRRLPSLGVVCREPELQPKPLPLRKRRHLEEGLGPVPTTPGPPRIPAMKSVNPVDAYGQTIYVAPDDTCFVVNGSPYDSDVRSRTTVDCPTELDDSAWNFCISGTLYYFAPRGECWCRHFIQPTNSPLDIVPCVKRLVAH